MSTGLDAADFTNIVLRNAFDLWFEPEIKRRQEAGSLPTPFPLWAAQVLLELGKTPIISFNDQIRGILHAQLDSGASLPIEKGAQLPFDQVGAIVGLQLTANEANAGHLTAIFHKDRWYLLFDFRYNATRVARHLDVSQQFLSAAEASIAKHQLNAAIDNLFACVELAAKSYLLMLPDERLLSNTRHGFVATEFNRHGGKHGNVNPEFVTLFNTLANLWTKARYPDEALGITEDTVSGWLSTARRMVADLDSKRPRIYGDGPSRG